MKERYWLSKRGSVFYSLDSQTRERKSLGVTDRREAQKIIQAKNESVGRPAVGLALAKGIGPHLQDSGKAGRVSRNAL
jgi:hypothetical protein